MRTLARPSLVLDEHHELLQVIGEVSPYCRIPEGRITAAATALLRPELQGEARALFLMVRADGRPVISRSLTLADDGGRLHLEARPLVLGERSLLLLSFVLPFSLLRVSNGPPLGMPAPLLSSPPSEKIA